MEHVGRSLIVGLLPDRAIILRNPTPHSTEIRVTEQTDRPQSEAEPKPVGDPPPAPQAPAGDPPAPRPDAIPDEDLDEVEEQPS